MRYTFVCDALRVSGGECGVYVHDAPVKCHKCQRVVSAGIHFTVGMLAKDKPMCSRCAPYSEQLTMLDALAEPSRTHTKPTHKTVEEVHTQGGDSLERHQCKACDGKGKVGSKITLKDGRGRTWEGAGREQCAACGGRGYIWKKAPRADVG